MLKLRVLKIIDGTTVDGPGFRTSIYLAGCSHKCSGCHNPESWDENSGTPMDIADIMQVIEDNGMPVTLSGGDPLLHPELISPLLQLLSERGINTWVYTGYTFESLLSDTRRRPLLDMIDVLVDGPFVMDLRDTSLHFKGSSNQRLIDLHKTLMSDDIYKPKIWHSEF